MLGAVVTPPPPSGGETGLGEHPAKCRHESCRVVAVDDEARPARQQLDGVGKGRRDDGPAGGDGIGEHAGGHLVCGVVRQHDHGGGLDQAVWDATSR